MPYYLRELRSLSGERIILQLDDSEGKILVGRRTHRPFFQLGEISRTHAAFSRDSDNWYVEDLSSRNGTFINGYKIPRNVPCLICLGDGIGFATAVEDHTPLSIYFQFCNNLPSDEIGLVWSKESLKKIPQTIYVDSSSSEDSGEDANYDVKIVNTKRGSRYESETEEISLNTSEGKVNGLIPCTTFVTLAEGLVPPYYADFWTKISENPMCYSYNNQELKIQLIRCDSNHISSGTKRPFEFHFRDKIECRRKKLYVGAEYSPGLAINDKVKCQKNINKKETFRMNGMNRSILLPGQADNDMEKEGCDALTFENKIEIANLDVKEEEESDTTLSVLGEDSTISLNCCKIQVGSLEKDPFDKDKHLVVTLEDRGFTFDFPAIKASKNAVSLTIKPSDIDRVEMFFDKISNLFLLLSPPCVSHVQNLLTGVDSKVHLFENHQKLIIFHIINFAEDQKKTVINYFRTKYVKMQVVNQERATECLKTYIKKLTIVDDCEPSVPVTTVLTYTPHPMDGISLTTKDVGCLNHGEFLNDVIIDFYLKFVFYEKLSEQDRNRTHVFSSFFYSRLISGGKKQKADDTDEIKLSRHALVKTWTKNLDIFSKDYIIIPINMKIHWFLVVICFPGKLFERSDCIAIFDTSNGDTNGSDRKAAAPTRSRKCKDDKGNVPVLVEYSDSDENEEKVKENAEQQNNTIPEDTYQLKEMPCICIFDSLRGPNRKEVLTTLRQYLQVEWKVKKESVRTFDRHTMQGFLMLCPQQTNFSDCGIYVLQFMEHFFKNPLPYFGKPMPNLSTWFTEDEVSEKRDELKVVVEKLQRRQAKKRITAKGRKLKADGTVAHAKSGRPPKVKSDTSVSDKSTSDSHCEAKKIRQSDNR